MLHEGLKYVSRETTGQKERFMHEDLLKRHLELVIEANKTTNITRISSWEDGMVLHVQDSLLGLDALNACHARPLCRYWNGCGLSWHSACH